ncbi:YfcC family protein [Sphingomonas oligophenolica]|uniref:YfcC family protein n=1 Tax=Sphingomonas oligophenolica TaxID=301154 RepID=A0ABU9YAC8_9SPHN
MSTIEAKAPKRRGHLHPVLIMVALLLATMVLTHLIPAGKYQRKDGNVVPGSYHTVPKVNGVPALIAPSAPTADQAPAKAAGIVAVFASIPAGMSKSASLIFMVMFVGGMFGVLRATGAIDAGIDRLLHLTSGNVYLLTTGLMLVLACGATFLGFISEYLVIIPVVAEMARRLKLPALFAPAVVLVPSFIGYVACVTNPLVLTVAQPLAGVPIFSGFVPRFLIFAAMFGVGLAYVLLYVSRQPKVDHVPEATRLTKRHSAVLMAVALGGIALLTGTGLWDWGSPELGAAFVAYGVLIAFAGKLAPGSAADAFLDGMQSMLLAGIMLGLASSMEILLQTSQVLDTVVQSFANMIAGQTSFVVVEGMVFGQMVFGFLIHSAVPKSAISLPILAPIAHFAGVSSQQTVTSLLVGTGLINMISPTNGLLLAFLAVAKVDYGEWFRFVAPLFAILCVVGFAAVYLITALGG